MRSRTRPASNPIEDLPFQLGWFPFPSVDGGAGKPTDAFGGADGFAVGKDAPPEAVDFLKFITDADNQRTWAKNSGLPANKEANDAVTDPNMLAVLDGLNNATFTQLFLDQFFTAEVGSTVNDETALLFAGADNAGGRRCRDHCGGRRLTSTLPLRLWYRWTPRDWRPPEPHI